MRRLLWFRRDLRVSDNPLLSYEGEVLPIFIFDTNILEKLHTNDKRVTYIFDAVLKLKKALRVIGLELKIFYGKPLRVIEKLQQIHSFEEVVASGDYDDYAKQRDKQISHLLPFRYLQDSYIFRHNEVLKDDGSPYYVFTPFYKKALKVLKNKDISEMQLCKQNLMNENFDAIYTLLDEDFRPLPLEIQSIGFEHQQMEILPLKEKLKKFTSKIEEYTQKRDFLTLDSTSHLSMELRFGTLGIRELLRVVIPLKNSESFVRQLIFRDFYAYLLFHIPTLEKQNYKYCFNGIEDEEKFQLFCKAKTGVPIVDAGVGELLETGDMHNRVRMIVASFFTKDLLLPWQWGEAFFAEYLLDYDTASNVLSWQWSAGTGVDPQPYFRIFNPYLQSKKFDKEAHYIKRFCPQLQNIEAKYLHNEGYLFAHDITGYPKPIVHHKEAAKVAIESFKH